MSPTARSLQLLRKNGFTADVAERYNSFTKQRHDLFGFADIVALTPGCCWAIQSTSAGNQSSRLKKILAEPNAKEWLEANGRIFVHGWGKYKLARGGKAVRWRCNEIEITLEHFA